MRRLRRFIRLRWARLVCRALGHKNFFTIQHGRGFVWLCCGRCHRNLSVWPAHVTLAGILSGEFMKVRGL